MKLATAAAITTLAAAAIGCKSSKDYIAQGDTLAAGGKNAEAILLYRKAIQKDAKSAEAYCKLGRAQRVTSDVNGALSSFLQAVALDPKLEVAQIELGDLYLGAYLNEKVKNQSLHQRISDIADLLIARNPRSPAALRYRGYLAISDRKPEAAISYFQQANALGPEQADVSLALIQALWMANRTDEARSTAHDLIEKNRTFAPVYDVLYAHEMSSGHAAQAEALLKLKIANNPGQPAFLIQLGEHYWRTNQHDDARKLLESVLTNQASEEIYREVSAFYDRVGELDRALTVLQRGFKQHPEQKLSFDKAQADILARQGKRDEAIRILDTVVAENPTAADARKQRAVLLLNSEEKAKRERARKDLEMLEASSPDDLDTAVQLGRAYAVSGIADKATQQFEAVLKKDGNSVPALLALAELNSTSRQFLRSLNYSDRVLAMDPRLSSARLVHATALVGLGQWDRARNEYLSLIRDQPAFAEARLQFALLNVSQKRFAEAEKQFRDLYRPAQGDFRALKGLVELYEREGRREFAIALLTEELNRYPESLDIRKVLAATAARANRPELALQQYEQILHRQPADPDLYTETGKLYQAVHNLQKSASMLQKAQELAPDDWRTAARLATVQQEAGLKQDAERNYKLAVQLGADDANLYNNLAYLEAEIGLNLDAAAAHAQKAIQKSPKDPTFADTLGFVYFKKNQTSAALQVFRNLTERFPKEAIFRYHLALALHQNGQMQAAAQELRSALETDRTLVQDPAARDMLRELNVKPQREVQ